MALVIRYRCHACGAHVEAQGRAAWVRCSHCRALVGYDWQAWFESPEYIAWLRSAPAQAPRLADILLAEQREVPCGVCGASVRRLARTHEAFRDHILGSSPDTEAALPRAPASAIPGVAVTEQDRLEQVLTGLAHQANQFAWMIQPSQYVRLVRNSFPGLSDSERAARLDRVSALSTAE